MDHANPFKWRHFDGPIILLCVRWYLRYSLSYRDLEEIRKGQVQGTRKGHIGSQNRFIAVAFGVAA